MTLQECTRKLEIAERRLLNAFQLIKNGKKISHLKYNEFRILMDEEHDSCGNIVNKCKERIHCVSKLKIKE